MDSLEGGRFEHPIGRSLDYAILFTVAASALVGVGLDQLINQILKANAGGTLIPTPCPTHAAPPEPDA